MFSTLLSCYQRCAVDEKDVSKYGTANKVAAALDYITGIVMFILGVVAVSAPSALNLPFPRDYILLGGAMLYLTILAMKTIRAEPEAHYSL